MTPVDWNVFFPPGAEIAVMPNPYDRSIPRLAASGASPLARWQASGFYPAFRWTGQIWRFGLRVMAAMGRLPSHLSDDAWPLGHFVHDVLPQVRHVTVLCGMPGPGQQFTVQLRDRRRRIVGYLKYAETETAQQRLATEHRLLSALPPDTGADVLKYGAFHKGHAMLTAPLRGRQIPPGQAPDAALHTFLQKLVQPSPPLPLDAHPYLQRMPRSEATAALYDVLGRRSWPVVIQHGDLLPWNLRRCAHGTLRAFDWEHGTLGGFPYLDLAYYAFLTAQMVRKWSTERAERHAAFILLTSAPISLSEREATALVRLAILDADCHAQRHNPAQDIAA